MTDQLQNMMTSTSKTDSPPLLKVHDLYKHFNVSGGLLDQLSFRHGRLTRNVELVKALNGITLEVRKGEALCLVGESGCGKNHRRQNYHGLAIAYPWCNLLSGQSD